MTSGSKNGQIQNTNFNVTYSGGSATPTTIQSVSISGAPNSTVSNATIGDTVSLTASATNATGTGTSTWTWASTNTAVATVSGGTVKYVGNGTTTITATSNYEASATGSNVGSASITVSNLKGSSENHFTVAEANTFISGLASNGTQENVYVDGIISQVDSFNSTYHSITYWISDDGTTTDQLEVYSGKGLNGADFISVDDIETGATVRAITLVRLRPKPSTILLKT